MCLIIETDFKRHIILNSNDELGSAKKLRPYKDKIISYATKEYGLDEAQATKDPKYLVNEKLLFLYIPVFKLPYIKDGDIELGEKTSYQFNILNSSFFFGGRFTYILKATQSICNSCSVVSQIVQLIPTSYVMEGR